MTWLVPFRICAVIVLATVLYAGIVQGLGRSVGIRHNGMERGTERLGTTQATVARVVDGDTIAVRLEDGRSRRVRLLGIDTPELPGECYARRAADELSALVPSGSRIRLVPDPSQDDVDRYGRLLRYAESTSGDLGLRQLEVGAAEVLETDSPVQRWTTYAGAQRTAVEDDRGRWERC